MPGPVGMASIVGLVVRVGPCPSVWVGVLPVGRREPATRQPATRRSRRVVSPHFL